MNTTTTTYFDCIVIGGGLGGLTAGATLSKLGKKVLLLEQHYIPGGCATTFKRKDYIMEVGLHEMDGLDEHDHKTKIFKFLGMDENVKFLKVPEFFRYKSDTLDFVQPHGRQETLDALIKQFPHEEKGIRTLLDTMDAVVAEATAFPSQKWKQLLYLPVMPFLYPNLVRAASQSLGDFLDEIIQDEELKLLLCANIGYYHDDPCSMSMITFSHAQSSFIRGGGHFIQGGSQKLSNYLASVIQDSGGQVLLGKKVVQILVENDSACGVAFVDSFNENLPETRVHADRVIFNGAIPLVSDLLPEKEGQLLREKFEHLEVACSLITMYLGFDKPPRDLGSKYYSTILANDDVKSIRNVQEGFRADWSKRTLIFVDYSLIDAKLAPPGKAVGAICTVDYLDDWETLDERAYKEKKEQVAKEMIRRLEKHLPGISNHIEHYELGTPKTIQSYVHTPNGAVYGYAQTPNQAAKAGRPAIQSPVKNLCFAGAWGSIGGGFTGAMTGGYLCGRHVFDTIGAGTCVQRKILDDSRYVRLLEKNKVAANTVELVFEKPKDLEYKPGQYAILELEHPKYQDLDMPIRPFSFASHPSEDSVRFTMRLSQSSYKKSVDALQKGERCRVFGPMGDLSIPPGDRGIVFLISGIGITPVLPLLKELKERSFAKPVFLFYSNRYEKSAAYHEQLQTIDLANYEYFPVTTSKEPRITAELLMSKLSTSLADFDYYLVGTSDFLHSMQMLLLENEVDRSQIVMDDFG